MQYRTVLFPTDSSCGFSGHLLISVPVVMMIFQSFTAFTTCLNWFQISSQISNLCHVCLYFKCELTTMLIKLKCQSLFLAWAPPHNTSTRFCRICKRTLEAKLVKTVGSSHSTLPSNTLLQM